MISLEESYSNSIEDERQALDRMASDPADQIQVKGDKDMLWYYNERFALYAMFIEHDILKAKQSFYVCGKIDEHLTINYDFRVLDYGVNHFSYALLSDSIELINSYANLTHPWFSHSIKIGSLTHAMQMIIKEDWLGLEKDISIYEKLTSTAKGKVYIPDLIFFKGVLKHDIEMIEQSIQLLLKDHKKRNKHLGIAQDFISIPALGYLKLAWLKGIKVEVKHPLIPNELLVISPLDNYDHKYEFLKS